MSRYCTKSESRTYPADLIMFYCIFTHNISTYTFTPSMIQDAGELCDWLTPTSGQDCGEAGDYEVYHTEDIPANEDVPTSLSWFVSQAITVHLIIGDDNDCSSSSGYFTMAYSMMGFASLALAGAAYAAKRRVTVGTTDDKATASFVEMKDVAVV